jgi:hypothetical protein
VLSIHVETGLDHRHARQNRLELLPVEYVYLHAAARRSRVFLKRGLKIRRAEFDTRQPF